MVPLDNSKEEKIYESSASRKNHGYSFGMVRVLF
jgi:hypothetical protein